MKRSVYTLQFELIALTSPLKGRLVIQFSRFFLANLVLMAVLHLGFCLLCVLFIHESFHPLLPSDTMCLRLHFMNVKP